MIRIDMTDVKEYEKDLKVFARRAFPFATKQTINRAAFATQEDYRERARNELTLRNKWTERSMVVDQARTLRVSNQEAVVGSLASYAATTEFGGTVEGGRGNKPIATSYAAGQGRGGRRTRLPRKANKMSNIKLRHVSARGGRQQRNAAKIKAAAGKGIKYVYLDLGRREGLFKVTGKKKFPKIQMVWDMSRRTVNVPATPLLGPATEATTQRMPRMYREALIFQLKRHRVLGY